VSCVRDEVVGRWDRLVRVVHCKREPFDVYIGRPSKWGNPYSHLKTPNAARHVSPSREAAISEYEIYLRASPALLADLSELAGKVLGCWCAPKPCHGEVLIRLCRERGLIE